MSSGYYYISTSGLPLRCISKYERKQDKSLVLVYFFVLTD